MSNLNGKRILVLEDEALVAFALEDMLIDLKCDVVGPVFDVAEGEALARVEVIDCAILDVRLKDGTCHSVAQVLDERRIPYLIASGLDDPDDLPNAKGSLGKPYRCSDVEAELAKLFL